MVPIIALNCSVKSNPIDSNQKFSELNNLSNWKYMVHSYFYAPMNTGSYDGIKMISLNVLNEKKMVFSIIDSGITSDTTYDTMPNLKTVTQSVYHQIFFDTLDLNTFSETYSDSTTIFQIGFGYFYSAFNQLSESNHYIIYNQMKYECKDLNYNYQYVNGIGIIDYSAYYGNHVFNNNVEAKLFEFNGNTVEYY
jgi:hypothetical protein